MKKRGIRKLLALVICAALVPGLMPWTGMTALAWDGNPYAGLVNTTTTVKFNDMDWYVIADDSTAANAGTVTLLAKDPIGASKFNENVSNGNAYSGSVVEGYLNGLTAAGGSFAGVMEAIAPTDLTDVSVTGAHLYLLSTEEANALPADIRKCSQADGAMDNIWWLRTPVSTQQAGFVSGIDGTVVNGGIFVHYTISVRPALRLKLSSVVFSSESNTFSLRQGHTHSFTYSASGATITAACSAPDCTLTDSRAELTIVKPTLTSERGTGSAAATLTGLNAFNAATGLAVSADSVKYYQATKNGNSYVKDNELTAAPTGAGDYVAEITVKGKAASVGYTIAPFNPYHGLVNTMTAVRFNGIEWYVIADGSTAVNAGTVTLLAKESFGKSYFNSTPEDLNTAYINSSVKHYLDSLTARGKSFGNVAYAIADTDLPDVGVTGAKLYLLSVDEALAVSYDIRQFPQATQQARMEWLLRTPYDEEYIVNNIVVIQKRIFAVDGLTGGLSYASGSSTFTPKDKVFEIRPALRLNLSSVVFSSESNTFSLRQDHTHSFTYSASGATITAVCSAPDCTLSNSRAKLTIVKPEHEVFGDGKNAEATITGSIDQVDLPPVVYQKGTEDLTAAPTDAGNYKASITLGNATASVEYEISKAAQAAPAAPTAENVTGNSVTLKKTDGYQYSMDGTDWQDSPVFTGLTLNTEYTFYQRIAGDANHEFSPASPGTAITTGIIAYTVTENKNTEYTVGSGVNIVYTVNRNVNDEETFINYSGVTMDGKAVPEGGSTARAGSLILTLKSSYLDTLSVGDHKVTISFKDGTVEAPLTIKAAAPAPKPSSNPVPKTGDNDDPVLWIGFFLLGITGLAVLTALKASRKKK